MDFPGGTVDKHPPAGAGDTGSIPGPGRFHVPWSITAEPKCCSCRSLHSRAGLRTKRSHLNGKAAH